MPYVEIVCYGTDIDNGLVEIEESGRVSEYYLLKWFILLHAIMKD